MKLCHGNSGRVTDILKNYMRFEDPMAVLNEACGVALRPIILAGEAAAAARITLFFRRE